MCAMPWDSHAELCQTALCLLTAQNAKLMHRKREEISLPQRRKWSLIQCSSDLSSLTKGATNHWTTLVNLKAQNAFWHQKCIHVWGQREEPPFPLNIHGPGQQTRGHREGHVIKARAVHTTLS